MSSTRLNDVQMSRCVSVCWCVWFV